MNYQTILPSGPHQSEWGQVAQQQGTMYHIIKGLCYLGVKNKEREEQMGEQQHVGHKILSGFTQKNDQLIIPSDAL